MFRCPLIQLRRFLAITTFSMLVFASQIHAQIRYPFIPNIGDVKVVDTSIDADSLWKGAPKHRRMDVRAWQLMVKLKQYPHAIEELARYYKTVGYTTRLKEPFSQYRTLFADAFSCFADEGTPRPWRQGQLDPFERADRFATWSHKNRDDFAQLNFDLPMRFGKLVRVRLGLYDTTTNAFPLSDTLKIYGTGSLKYRFEQPQVSPKKLPWPTEQARGLISRLGERQELHALISYQVNGLERDPRYPTGVYVNVEGRRIDYFLPGNYKRPIYSEKEKSLIPETTQLATSDTEGADRELLGKMMSLCRDLKLMQIDGIPVADTVSNLRLTSTVSELIRERQARLADRLALAIEPQLLDPESKWTSSSLALQAYRRLLGNSVVSKFLNSGQSDWFGDDEFARLESKHRFFHEHSNDLRKMAVRLPLRLRTLKRVTLEDYSFEDNAFPLKRNSDNRSTIRFSLNSLGGNWFLQHDQPKSYFTTDLWEIPPSKAKQVSRETINSHQGERTVFESVVFDVIGRCPNLNSPSDRLEFGTSYLVQPRSAALYADAMGRKKLADLPLETPPVPVNLVEQPSNPPRSSRLFLWRPEVQVALLELAGHSVANGDWASAAAAISLEDTEYYSYGDHLPYDVEGNQRQSMLYDIMKTINESRHWQHRSTTQWREGFRPFFPPGYLNSSVSAMKRDWYKLIDAAQTAKIRGWMRERIRASQGEFHITASVHIDRKAGVGNIVPGEAVGYQGSFGECLPDDADYGMVRLLGPPRGQPQRMCPEGMNISQFYIAFPAIEEKMQFSCDVDKIPESQLASDGQEVLEGSLIVRLVKIEDIGDDRNTRVIHVRPIRFEKHDAKNLGRSGKRDVQFSTPVEVKKFTRADSQREHIAKMRAAVEAEKQERLREQAKIAEDRRAWEAKYEREQFEQNAEKVRREEEQRVQAELAAEQFRQMEAESEAANVAANRLLGEGYSYDDIDWSTGKLVPGTKPISRIPIFGSWFTILSLIAFAIVTWISRTRIRMAMNSLPVDTDCDLVQRSTSHQAGRI